MPLHVVDSFWKLVMRSVTIGLVIVWIVKTLAITFLGSGDIGGIDDPDTDTLAAPGINVARVLQRLLWILGVQAANVLVVQSAPGPDEHLVQLHMV
jgi:hypothetical protein